MEAIATPAPAYEQRICASTAWWNINWRELWQYRDLLVLLVRRDFMARYAQSALGPVWFIIQPLLTTLVFVIVFGGIAKIPTGGLPPALFYMCNQLVWIYFSGCFSSTSNTLSGNQQLFSKVYFPRLIVPIAALASNAFTLIIQFITFLVFFAYFKVSGQGASFHFTVWVILLPLLIVHVALLAGGIGLLMSSLTAKYRDLTQLSGLMIQLGMYATPVIYPLAGVPEKWRWLISLNPLTFDVELVRIALLGSGTLVPMLAITSLAFTLLILFCGIAAFTRAERTFVDIA